VSLEFRIYLEFVLELSPMVLQFKHANEVGFRAKTAKQQLLAVACAPPSTSVQCATSNLQPPTTITTQRTQQHKSINQSNLTIIHNFNWPTLATPSQTHTHTRAYLSEVLA
jgi:hypothetical protein